MPELIHLSVAPFTAACGADEPNQSTTTIREHVTCRCCLGQHDYEWITQPSTPSGPAEYFKVCKKCGAEEPGSDYDA